MYESLFVSLRGWKVDIKTFNIMCLFFVFLLFPNNVWGEISIIGNGIIKPLNKWFTPPDPVTLAIGEFGQFKATASRGNPHSVETPGVVVGNQEVPGVSQDPELGYTKFSATGNAKLSIFSKDKKECGWLCRNTLTHSVKYKWNNPGFYTVTAKIFDKDGIEHDSVSWQVKVGDPDEINQAFEEEVNTPLAEITILKKEARTKRHSTLAALGGSPAVSYGPGQFEHTVGHDLFFEVEATCEDGIESIQFSGYNPNYCKGSCKTYSVIKKYTFNTLGQHTVSARVTSKRRASEVITWTVNVVPEVPKFPDLWVSVSHVNQEIRTISVLDVSGNYVEVPLDDPNTLTPGSRFQLGATVQNIGYEKSSPTNLRFYRSSDSNISADEDALLRGIGSSVPSLKAGKEIEISKHFTVPTVPGVYYYGACVDSRNSESDVDNNCSNPVKITVRSSDQPDLVVGLIPVNKDVLTPGDSFTLTATVQNQGKAAAQSATLRFYSSSDPNISTNDTQLHTARVNALNAGKSVTRQKRVIAPREPGVYYYGVCIDGAQGERNTNNNCSQAIAITVQAPALPDLVIESISASSNVVGPGENFTLFVTVRNQGTAASLPTALSYHDPNGGQIGTDRIGRLLPSVVSEQSIIVRAPDRVGTYYYDACVESPLRSDESNLDNNCSVELAITVGTPTNRVPVAVGRIPTQTLGAGAARQVDVSIYFRDPNGDRLTYRASSNNTNIATARVHQGI